MAQSSKAPLNSTRSRCLACAVSHYASNKCCFDKGEQVGKGTALLVVSHLHVILWTLSMALASDSIRPCNTNLSKHRLLCFSTLQTTWSSVEFCGTVQWSHTLLSNPAWCGFCSGQHGFYKTEIRVEVLLLPFCISIKLVHSWYSVDSTREWSADPYIYLVLCLYLVYGLCIWQLCLPMCSMEFKITSVHCIPP